MLLVCCCLFGGVQGAYLPSLGKCHPEDKHKLKDVVEGEPVDGVDGRLNNGQEGVGDPVLGAHFVSSLLTVNT
jgi:hypothetical protein